MSTQDTDTTTQQPMFVAEAKAPRYKADADGHAFELEPIRGFPELRWAGKRPFRSIPYYPAQLRESYAGDNEKPTNEIYWGDNLQVMSHLLRRFRGKVKLVYIDPPYDSKADYKRTIKLRGTSTTNDHGIFEEKQYTDIWTNDEYLQFMYERLILIRELLSDDGSLWLHCDWHRSHHLRCVLDEVFGPDNFINEIVWKRANTVKGNFGQGAVGMGSNVDSIFFYRKTATDTTFNPVFLPYSQEYIDAFFRFTDDDGRRYRLTSMTGPGGASKGNPRYEVMGVTRYWRYSEATMQSLIDAGLVVQTKPGGVPQRKQYLDDGDGVALQTLWTDIPGLAARSSERIGYPTQKPETLLSRVVEISTNDGDIVFDCFMGSGTAQAVALKMGRQFLGTDINLGAIQATTQRLLKEMGNLDHPPGLDVYSVNNYEVFRNPVQAKELLVEALQIQPLHGNSVYDGEKDGRLVKIMPVNRIATRQDLNELITNFNYKLFERRKHEAPHKPVERLLIVCMGHEPDLGAHLQHEVPYKLDVEVVDVLRDRADLQFKRDSEARVVVVDGELRIEAFYPMALLQKLSVMKEDVGEWRELVDSILVDFNYDGAVMQPDIVDVPDGGEMVTGCYAVPDDAGTIRVRITDLLSESWEGEVALG